MPYPYKCVKFNNGLDYPILGLGTWQSKVGAVKQAIIDAIDAGYRHIDCALVYQNEAEIGEALKIKFGDGTIKREDIFITSKLWNTFHSKDLVAKAVSKTLKDLGVAYLDLYLIHWPMGYQEGGEIFPKGEDDKVKTSEVDYVDSWLGMEEMVKQGLVRSIGVSNFNKDQIERIIAKGSIVPANIQVECHPYLNQKKLIDYCRSKGITVTAYSPLGSPARPWAVKGEPTLMEDPKVVSIANKYSKSSAQILIKYQLQRGNVCIPKSVTKGRIIENFSVWDFELTQEDMGTIDSFDCNGRLLHLDWMKDHIHYPFNTDF